MTGPRRSRCEATDDGYSLIELLISLMLVSIVVIGVIGLIGTLLIAGDDARTQADAESLARSAAEEVKAWKYAGCVALPAMPYTGPTAPPLPDPPQGSELSYEPIEVTYGAPDISGSKIDYSGACLPTVTRAHRVTVQVKDAEGDVLARAIVTKRRPCGPASVDPGNGKCKP